MQIDLGGHPLHTRALAIEVSAASERRWSVKGYIIDLRKRGFVPVGSELQGTGIIHHMELRAQIDPLTGVLEELVAAQPTVAFEASAATCGESCRDPLARLQALVGTRIEEEFSSELRRHFGGIAGCSHLLTLAQLLAPAVMRALERERGSAGGERAAGQRIFRRDLVFDGHELSETRTAVAVQAADLHFRAGAEVCLPMDRFEFQEELRLQLDLDGWPATITTIAAERRSRGRDDFVEALWESCDVAALAGLKLGRGSSAEIARLLDSRPPLRDALLMLTPALIQCRAALPDKWTNQVASTAGHPGLIAMADSCYMWRRGGGLERTRDYLK